jgi:hypothetical protein
VIIEAILDQIFGLVETVISWIPVVTFPALAALDFGPIAAILSFATFLLPVEAYAAVLVMWGVVWVVRFGIVPVRWLRGWL